MVWLGYAIANKQPLALIGALIFFELVVAVLAFLSWTKLQAERKAVKAAASQPVTQPAPSQPQTTQIATAADEELILAVAGIFRNGDRNISYNPLTGSEKITGTENALLLTNRALYLIYVPIGTNPQTGDYQMNTGMMEYMLNQKNIRATLDQMLTTQPLNQIINSSPMNFVFQTSTIASISIRQFTSTIKIKTSDGKELNYAIREKSELTALEQALSQVLPGKVIIK